MKPPLQVPVTFGHWLVEGDQLVCRLPRRTVAVQAPRQLLSSLMQLCDGALPWSDVVARLGEQWPAETVAAFLLQLAHEGLLVEAGELWAHWSQAAQLPQPTLITTSEAEISRLHSRAEARLLPGVGIWHEAVRLGADPVAATLARRESFRTFDDQPVSQETLCSVLWAAHGVTRPSTTGEVNWHRTSGSGGNMHSARWFVAALRELPSHDGSRPALAPGVYEARFHQEGGSSLQPVAGRAQTAWRALRDPRVLRYASALVLPIYDIAVPARKYGNRATLFALLEAGQCLQNAQLMATSLDAACMLRGDTIADEAIALAGLGAQGSSHWLAVPGLVLGARPSEMQRTQQACDNRLRVAPNLRPHQADGFAFAASLLPAGTGSSHAGSGRAESPQLAMTKAEAEAWERLAWATPCALVEARLKDLAEPLLPQELVAYSPRQYATAGFAFKPFAPRRAYLWSQAIDTETGHSHAVPAECVHALDSLPPRFQRQACTNASTSGVAAGAQVEDALMRATLELIERDAFVCAWLAGAAPAHLEAASLPRVARRRIDALRANGLEVSVLDLRSGWCPALAVFAQSTDLPFTSITAAASFDREQALLKALEEAEGRFAHARNFPVAKAGVDAMREIERYYRNPRTYRRSDFFAQAFQSERFTAVGRGCARDWNELKARIRVDGYRLLAADITPAQAAVDQGRVPLRVVRAFVPGLVPIWFQRGMQPQGMPKFLKSAGGRGGRPAGLFVHPFT